MDHPWDNDFKTFSDTDLEIAPKAKFLMKKKKKKKKRKSTSFRLIWTRIVKMPCIKANHPICIILRLLELPIFAWKTVMSFLMYVVGNPEGPIVFMDFWKKEKIDRYFEIIRRLPKDTPLKGNFNPDIMRPQYLAQSWRIPDRIYYDCFVLLRLAAMCFVGVNRYGRNVLDPSFVLRDVTRRRLLPDLLTVLPIYLLEIWMNASENPVLGILCTIYILVVSVKRLSFLLKHDYGMGNSRISVRLSRYAFCIFFSETYLTMIWMLMPYVQCPERFPRRKLNIVRCYDSLCNFIQLNVSGCLKDTWFSEVTNKMAQFPFLAVDQSPKKMIELTVHSPSFPNTLYDLGHFFVWSTIHRIGAREANPISIPEEVVFMFYIFYGYFALNWYLTAVISTFFYERDWMEVEYKDKLNVIDSYCKVFSFGEKKRKYLREFVALRYQNNNSVLNNELFSQMPFRHQDTMRYYSCVSLLQSTRIFDNVDEDILHGLAHFLENRFYLEGETIVQPGTVAPGLMIIRKGTVMVVALWPKGEEAVALLKKGECFGEINLCRKMTTPLLFLAKSDCHILLLQRASYFRILDIAPKTLKRTITSNHNAILETSRCKFQKDLKPNKPDGLIEAIRVYYKANQMRFPKEYCIINQIEEKHVWTNTSKYFIVWSWIIATLSLFFWFAIFTELYSNTWLEVFWPDNFVDGFNEKLCSHKLYFLDPYYFPIITLICLADFIIWMSINIWSEGRLLCGAKALKHKLSKKLNQTIINFVSIFLFGYKINTFIDVTNNITKWNFGLWSFIIIIICMCLATIHYSIRLFLFISYRTLSNYCLHYEKALKEQVCKMLNTSQNDCFKAQCHFLYTKTKSDIFRPKYCNNIYNIYEPPNNVMLRNLASAKAYSNILSSRLLEKFCRTHKNKDDIINFWTSRYGVILVHFIDYVFAFGNSNTYVAFTNFIKTVPFMVGTVFAMFATTTISAKIACKSMVHHKYLKFYNENLRTLKNLLQSQDASLKIQCISYFRLNYLIYNRIYYLPKDKLINLPLHIKNSGKVQNMMMKGETSLFDYDYDFKNFIVGNGNYVFYPPGYVIWYSSTADVSLFRIIRGVCLSVDDYGVVTQYGPNDTVGIIGLWLGMQPANLLTKTYVMGFYIREEIIYRGLLNNRKMQKDWLDVLIRTAPAREICSEDIQVLFNHKQRDEKTHELISNCASTFYIFTKKNRYPRIAKVLNIKFRLLSVRFQFVVHCLIMSTIYIISVIINIFQAQMLADINLLRAINSFLDSLIITEAYAVFQQTLVTTSNWKEIMNPFSILYHVVIVFPWDILISLADTTTEYVYLRPYILVRFLEPFRRLRAFKKVCPEYLTIILIWEYLSRTTIHILLLTIFLTHTICDPIYSETQKGSRCTIWSKYSYSLNPGRDPDVKKIYYSSFAHGLQENTFPLTESGHVILGLKGYIHKVKENIVSYVLPKYYENGMRLLIFDGDQYHISNSLLAFYSIVLYLSTSLFTNTGLWINVQLNSGTEIFNYTYIVCYFINLIHAIYLIANTTGVFISLNRTSIKKSQRLKNLKQFLEVKEINNRLRKQASINEEIYLSSDEFLVTLVNEYDCIPSHTLTQMRLSKYRTIYHRLGLSQIPKDQLSIVTNEFNTVFVPRGQEILEEGQIIDSIFILLNGKVAIPNEEMSSDIRKATKSSKSSKNSKASYKHRLTKKVLDNSYNCKTLNPGACFGIKNSNPSDFKLEVWRNDVIALSDCVLLRMNYKALKKIRDRAGLIVEKLYGTSLQTYLDIKDFYELEQVSVPTLDTHDGTERIHKGPIYKLRTNRRIFHPASTGVNAFLMTITSVQFFLLLYCFLLIGFDCCHENLKKYLLGRKVNYELEIFLRIWKPFTVSSLCSTAYFVLFVYMGYHDKKSDMIVMDPASVWKFSLRPFRWILYFLCVQPIGLIIGIQGYFNDFIMPLTVLPMAMQMIYVLRYYRLERAREPVSLSLSQTKQTLGTVYVLLFFFTILTMFWMGWTCLDTYENRCDISWIGFAKRYYTVNSIESFIVRSFVFVCNVVSNTGGGNVIPQTTLERLLVIFFMLFGFLVGGYFQALVITKINSIYSEENRKEEKIKQFSLCLEKNGIDEKSRCSIMNYIRYSSLGLSEDWEFDNILSDLHPLLSSNIKEAVTHNFIYKIKLMKLMDNNFYRFIANFIKKEVFLPGDMIVKFGDVIDKVIYVSHGSCYVTFQENKSPFEIKNGDLICEPYLYSPAVVNFSVEATNFCVCFTLNHEVLTQVIISLTKFFMNANVSPKQVLGFTNIKDSKMSVTPLGSLRKLQRTINPITNKLGYFINPLLEKKNQLQNVFGNNPNIIRRLAWKFVTLEAKMTDREATRKKPASLGRGFNRFIHKKELSLEDFEESDQFEPTIDLTPRSKYKNNPSFSAK